MNARSLVAAASTLLALPALAAATPPSRPIIQITADLSDAPRKLYHAEIDIPVTPGVVNLTTPEWIPGNHRPTGPAAEITGVVFSATDPDGKKQTLTWRRDDTDLYQFHVTVPRGVTTLHAHLDCIVLARVSQKLAVLEWEKLLLYPANTPVKEIPIQPSVTVPAGWGIGTALTPTGKGSGTGPITSGVMASNGQHTVVTTPGTSTTQFAATNVEQLEDSPVIAGEYFHEFALARGVCERIQRNRSPAGSVLGALGRDASGYRRLYIVGRVVLRWRYRALALRPGRQSARRPANASGLALNNPGEAPGFGPTVAVDSSGIVAVNDANQIEELGLNGVEGSSWGGLAVDDFAPVAAFEDSAGDVDVLDLASGHDRVVQYPMGGGPPTVLAQLGSQFWGYPPSTYAAMDARGDILIDQDKTLVTLDPSGQVLSDVTVDCDGECGPLAVAPNGNIYVLGFDQLYEFTPTGARVAVWNITAGGIAVDSAGNLYLSNISPDTITKYDPTMHRLDSWHTDDETPFTPFSIAVNSSGNVYATSTTGVSVYTNTGQLITTWPNPAPFDQPNSTGTISVAPNGDVFVADGLFVAGLPVSDTPVVRYSDVNLPPPPPSNQFTIEHIAPHPDGTTEVRLVVPGPGLVQIMETAWDDNVATAASAYPLKPAPRRFVIARKRVETLQAGPLRLLVTLNHAGTHLLHHHRYRIPFRLWVSYTPTNGRQRNIGIYALHFVH